MVATATRRVALVSIYPEYANAILDGTKRVEFRRSVYPSGAKYVVIYATSPVQRILGWFEIDRIATDTPAELWRQYGSRGAIGRLVFQRYYASCEIGAAIEVVNVVRLDAPLRLDSVSPSLRPPQSYRYLPEDAAAAIGVPT